MSARPSSGFGYPETGSSRRPGPRSVGALIAALALTVLGMSAVATLVSAAPTCSRSWDGGAGSTNWGTPANWDGDVLPGTADHACISAGNVVVHSGGATTILSLQSQGAVTLSGGTLTLTDTANASMVTTFTQSAGTLAGSGTLTVLGTLDWTGGAQTGSGTTLIDADGSATIDAVGDVDLRGGRTFDNQGSLTWSSGQITMYQSLATTTLLNSGTFETTFDGFLVGTCCDAPLSDAVPVFHNIGTFTKTAGDGTTSFLMPFDNDGSLQAEAGTISLGGVGEGTSTGSFGTAADSLIVFNHNYTLATGATFAGNIKLLNGTLTLATDISMPVGRTFTQSAGTLAGSGTLTVLGTLDWTGGAQTGSGTTLIDADGSATIDAVGDVDLRGGRTFDNQGSLTWSSGQITMYQSLATTTLLNSGTFETTFDGFLVGTCCDAPLSDAVPVFHNIGTFTKTAGDGTTSFLMPFDNDGSLQAEAGTISLGGVGEGTSTGSFGTAANSLIVFNHNYTLATGATFAGNIKLLNGTLTLATDISMPVGRTFTQAAGTLAGSGTLTVLGTLDWTGGAQTGSGTTLIDADGSATIDAVGDVDLRGGRTFDNQGSLTWSSGQITVYQSSAATSITNSGLMDVTGNFFVISTCCDGPPSGAVPATFENTGTILKSAGSGTSTILIPFNNVGEVRVESGTLAIRGDFANYIGASRTLLHGTWSIATTLDFSGADIDTIDASVLLDGPTARIIDQSGANGLRRLAAIAPGGDLTLVGGADILTSVPFSNEGILAIGPDSSFTSTGVFDQAGGVTTLDEPTSSITATGSVVRVTGGELTGTGSAGPAVVVDGGTLSPGQSPGTITASGTYQQTTDGTLSIEIGGTTPGADFDVLAATGPAAIGGTVQIELLDGFVPSPGDTFKILTTSSRSGQFLSLLGTELGGGLALTAQYNATDVTLVVTDQALSINDIAVTEGNAGTVSATFTVTLAEASSQTVTVDYETRDETAEAGADYASTANTLTFLPGQTSKTIVVAVNGDTLDEDDETFAVDLSNPVNAPLSKGEGTGSIVDDDPLSTVSIAAADATVSEGNAGTVEATFIVSLTPATGRTVTVQYATVPNTATSPADYAAQSGSVVFQAGDTEQTIVVLVKGDTLVESNETFFVDLSAPVKAVLGTVRATGTIVDDDVSTISVAGVSVDEGNDGTVPATFIVSLSAPASQAVSVDYATADQSATAPDDYLPGAGTVSFAIGEMTKSVTIQVVGDTIPEANETFELLLTNPVGATFADPNATGTIADDGDITGTPNFQMLISPSSQVLPPGGSAQYVLRIIGLFGFDDPVTLSTPDLPAGISASWSINPVALPGLSILTLTAGPGVTLGEEGFTVRGTGGGITNELQANTTLDFGLIPICYGNVEGYVTDQETGAPIPDARISLTPLIETDANGHYLISDIELDEFNNPIVNFPVRASKAGYWDGLATATVVCNGVTRADMEMLKWRPASVAGIVVEGMPDEIDPTIIRETPVRTPIEGVNVSIRDFAGDDSGADGAFDLQLEKLNPGNAAIEDAQLTVFKPGYWARPSESIGGLLSSPYPIGTLEPDEHMTGLIVPLVKKCTGELSGVVRDAVTGQPIVNALVSVQWPIVALEVRTDADGEFTYPGILLGHNNTPIERSVGISAPGYIDGFANFQMNVCGDTPAVEIEMVLAPPPIFGTLQGHVYDAITQQPIAGASVFTPVCAQPPATTCATTDATGFYRLQNVPLVTDDGPVQVLFFSELRPTYYGTSRAFSMSANATTEQDFELFPTKHARLTGIVTDRFTGEPIVGAGGLGIGFTTTSPIVTDQNGRYLTDPIELPPPGDATALTLRFEAVDYWPQQKSKAVHDAVEPFELNFDLLPICDDATVQGTVINAVTNQPIVGASVVGGGHQVVTNDQGFYRLEGLQVGTNNDPLDVLITVSKQGFHPLRKTVKVFCNATLTVNFGPPDQPGTIVIQKTVEPATSSRAFTFSPTFAPAFDLSGGGSTSFTGLVAGSGYSVTETVPAGWRQDSATCSDGSPVTNINLAPGETVTCTFVNRQLATLIVRKTTDPDPDPSATSFGFSAGGGLSPSTFNLANGETQTYTNVVPGSGYDLSETVPAGWQQDSATCSDGSPVTDIDLAVAETVTCTFVNSERPAGGTIIVAKQTEPAGSNVSFPFTRSWGAGFSLRDGQSQTFTDLAAGSGYSVSESLPSGWVQARATCSDGSPATNIDLAAGETVTCTFVNRQLATLIIRKQTQPSPAPAGTSFAFTASAGLSPTSFSLANGDSRTFVDVSPGTGYAVSETLPAGWQQFSATCSDGSPVSNVDLAPGETVTCTFVNRQLATLIIRKQTQPNPDLTATSFAFNATGGLSPGTFSLANGGSRTFSSVTPGSGYAVSETLPVGWQQASVTCSDNSPPSNINLAAGETVTCTFVNRRTPLQTGAHTIGFWQNKNGQAIIKSGATTGSRCASATWLRQLAPFQDLAAQASCNDVAVWVAKVVKAASATGPAMNPMLKAQALATALSVYFSDPALGGNKLGAAAPIGGLTVDLKAVCIMVDKATGEATCSGIYRDASAAFGGASTMTVRQALDYAASKSNAGGSVWYANVKATQSLAKDLFDAINNRVAFGPL